MIVQIHDKTNNVTYAPTKDSLKAGYLSSLISLCCHLMMAWILNNLLGYYTIIDFNEVDIRIYLPEKVIIHRDR